MCCRFWVDQEVDEELEKMNIGFPPGNRGTRHDIRPADSVWIIGRRMGSRELSVSVDRWGFLTRDQKLMINARAESVFDRKMFREGVLHHRIAVPAAGFYEWNAEKEKNRFQSPGGILFMAGLADYSGGVGIDSGADPSGVRADFGVDSGADSGGAGAGSGADFGGTDVDSGVDFSADSGGGGIGGAGRFVIITTAANASMKPVHDRMPLILEKDQLDDWILDDSMTERLLRQVPVSLSRYSDYEQMSLF